MSSFDAILQKWESAEHSVEEKLDSLEKYIFSHLGFEHEPSYYEKNGSFFARYIAGFIDRYFTLIRDMSFILLDPFHIFDILTNFAKGIIKHPIKTLKQIWNYWTYAYQGGAFGLGALTADALLAALIAGASSMLIEEESAVVAKNMSNSFGQNLKGSFTGVGENVANVTQNIKKGFTNYEEFFDSIKSSPQKVLQDAQKSLASKVSYGEIYKYKYYAVKS